MKISDKDLSGTYYLKLCNTEAEKARLIAYVENDQNAHKTAEQEGVSRRTIQTTLTRIISRASKNHKFKAKAPTKAGPSLPYSQFLQIIKMSQIKKMSNREIGRAMGMAPSTISRILNRKGYEEYWEQYDKEEIGGTTEHPFDREVTYKGKSVLFVTAAQNRTHIHEDALASIKQFCKHRDAELKVITFTYSKNASQRSEKGEGWYDDNIKEYITDDITRLAPDLVIQSMMNTLPSAVNPFQGLEGFCQGRSSIFAHAKQELQSVAQPKDVDPAMMYSTGAITLPNYRQQKAGQKAEFDHIIGGLVVEICEDGTWFVRQVSMESDTGNFYDLDTYYTPEGWTEGHAIAGLNPGDIHTQNIHPEIAEMTLGVKPKFKEHGVIDFIPSEKTSIVKALRPRHILYHDICDFKDRNHHNIKNPHFRYKQFVNQEESILVEIENVGKLLDVMERTYENSTGVVVNSNHDRATIRYLVDQVSKWHEDPVNAVFFLQTQLAYYKAIERGEDFDPLEWNIKNLFPELTSVFLKQDESYMVEDVECGYHGDTGLNGAKGSLAGLKKMGVKLNLGHSHSAGIKSGVYQAGITCDRNPDYAKGPSSWTWSHILTYENGKRTIVTMRISSDNEVRWKK